MGFVAATRPHFSSEMGFVAYTRPHLATKVTLVYLFLPSRTPENHLNKLKKRDLPPKWGKRTPKTPLAPGPEPKTTLPREKATVERQSQTPTQTGPFQRMQMSDVRRL